MSTTKIVICPYCGLSQPVSDRCTSCGGLFEPLSRQATLNAMGPWFVRDTRRPFQPGCSYETLVTMIDRRRVTKNSVIRGPTTRQLWTVARRVKGVAHLLGYCHGCDASVDPGDHACHACGAQFGAFLDRNYLGLPGVRPLPWEADVDEERGRISRFASDEELFDAGSGRTDAPGDGSAARGEAPASEAPAASPAGPGAGWEHAALTRALQRKVSAQSRTIRLLSVLLAVAAVVALASYVPVVLRRVGSGPDRQLAGPQEAQAPVDLPEGPPPRALVEVTGAAEPQQPRGDAEETAIETQSSSESPPLDPAAEPGRESGAEPQDLDSLRRQAMALLESAERTDRPLHDRLDDCDLAAAILEAMPPTEEGGPADRDQMLAAVRRMQEYLRIRLEFFG
jgi:hypothetical protein